MRGELEYDRLRLWRKFSHYYQTAERLWFAESCSEISPFLAWRVVVYFSAKTNFIHHIFCCVITKSRFHFCAWLSVKSARLRTLMKLLKNVRLICCIIAKAYTKGISTRKPNAPINSSSLKIARASIGCWSTFSSHSSMYSQLKIFDDNCTPHNI